MSGGRWARRAALRSVPLLLGPLAAELRWALERPAESQARLRRRISAALLALANCDWWSKWVL